MVVGVQAVARGRPAEGQVVRDRDHLGTSALSGVFGVSTRLVATWLDRGLLPCWKIPGGKSRRVRKADLEAFLEGQPEPYRSDCRGRLEALGNGSKEAMR